MRVVQKRMNALLELFSKNFGIFVKTLLSYTSYKLSLLTGLMLTQTTPRGFFLSLSATHWELSQMT